MPHSSFILLIKKIIFLEYIGATREFQVIFHKWGRVFHQGFQTQENWWKHEAEGFYCFRVFGNPVETRSLSWWNGFSKGPNLLTMSVPWKVFCFFSQLLLFNKISHTLHWRPHLQFWEMEEAVTERSSRFQTPKSCKEEVSLLKRSKPKSSQYKDKWAVDVFRNWQAARGEKFPLLEPGSVFGYLFTRVWICSYRVSRGIHVTQMRPHNRLIASALLMSLRINCETRENENGTVCLFR